MFIIFPFYIYSTEKDLRHGFDLCKDEKKFIHNRKKKVYDKIRELLQEDDAPVDLDEVKLICDKLVFMSLKDRYNFISRN